MAAGNSYVTYSGDGVTKTFVFSFPYLDPDHVTVLVDGLAVGFTLTTTQSVELDIVPASGATVRIQRNTPFNQRLVDFTDGGILKEADLDKAFNQLFFFLQEMAENSLFEAFNHWHNSLYYTKTQSDANLSAAQTALETEDGRIRTFIGKDAAGTVYPQYSSNNYLTDGHNLETSFGVLDANLKAVHDLASAADTQADSNTTEINSVLDFIGKSAWGAETPNYSSANHITQGADLVQAIGELDAAIPSGSWSQQFQATGYSVLPNGTIIQWGVTPSAFGGDASYAVTFPMAFPNACLVPIAVPVYGDMNGDNWATGALSKTGFTIYNTGPNARNFYWLAIGY